MVARVQMIEAAFAARQMAVEGDDGDHLDRLEKIILKHRPLGPEDAGMVLTTALENLRYGGRSDELDVRAVERVIQWIESQDIAPLRLVG